MEIIVKLGAQSHWDLGWSTNLINTANMYGVQMIRDEGLTI